MAKKTKSSAAKVTSDEKSTVTRISAKDSASKQPVEKKTVAKKADTKKKAVKAKKVRRNPFKSFIGYFKGAWHELTQVRWPNRRATWSLTAAVIIFTGFFVGLIVLLDLLFKFLFEQLLG